MPEAHRYFFINESGEGREITEDEHFQIIREHLGKLVTDEYTTEDLNKDCTLIANMAAHVSSGFIDSTGLIQGKKIKGFFSRYNNPK